MVGKALCITTLLTSWINVAILTDVLFILPDNPSNTSCPFHPCATLSQYLLDYNGTLPVVSNVEYKLLPGEHYVPLNMKLHGLYNFTFIGITEKSSTFVVVINCLGSFLEIIDSEYLIIRNVVFRQCKTAPSNEQYHGIETNLFIGSCWSCAVDNVTFFKYGLIGHNVYGWPLLNNVIINLTVTSTNAQLS